jgi:hypothetical protein
MNSFFDYSSVTKYPIILDFVDSPSQMKIFVDNINTFHSYKKFSHSPTRNLRFNIYETVSGNNIGSIGLSSATISIKCRDEYIGWNKDQRLKNLGMVANNSRCCFIKQNITIKNTGTMVLKQLRIVGSKKWLERYGQQLVLLETFVRPDRDSEYNGEKLRKGSIYLADNWVEVGITKGVSLKKGPLGLWRKEGGVRGELARTDPKAALEKYGYADGKEYIITKSEPKIMFVKPLVNDWKKKLIG